VKGNLERSGKGGKRDMEEKDFQRIEKMIGNFKEEVKDDFRIQAGILSEDFQHKLQLVAEGHQMLAEKMDRMHKDIEGVDRKADAGTVDLAGSIRQLDKKIDVVTADLAAHRADTEGHKRGYQVSEP
jgi:hypothetical protein